MDKLAHPPLHFSQRRWSFDDVKEALKRNGHICWCYKSAVPHFTKVWQSHKRLITEAFCDSTAQRDLGNFKVSLWKGVYIVFRLHWIKSYRKSELQCVCEKSCSGVEGGDDHILKLVSLSFVPQPLLHPGEMIEGLKMRRCRIMDTKGGRVSEGWASRMGRGRRGEGGYWSWHQPKPVWEDEKEG